MKKAKVSKYGQWKYPGEDTIIPNANGSITMKGVPYPVLGIDDQGNQKMMMPGMDYQFPGNSVYEIPMMAYGGYLPKAQSIGEILYVSSEDDPAYIAYNDSLNKYNQGNKPRLTGKKSFGEYGSYGLRGRNVTDVPLPEGYTVPGTIQPIGQRITRGYYPEYLIMSHPPKPAGKDYRKKTHDIYKEPTRPVVVGQAPAGTQTQKQNPQPVVKPNYNRPNYNIKTTGDAAIDRLNQKLYGPDGLFKLAYGGDISVPDLRRVTINALPKAQSGPSSSGLTSDQQQNYEDRYLVYRDQGDSPRAANNLAFNDASYFGSGPIYNFQSFLPNPDSGVRVASGKRFPYEHIDFNTYDPWKQMMSDPDYVKRYNEMTPEQQEIAKNSYADENAENYFKSVDKIKNWEKNWYSKRAQLPQFTDVANKRLSLIESINMQPFADYDEYKNLAPGSGGVYIPADNFIGIPSMSFNDPSTIAHERSHWYDWNAPQNDDLNNRSYLRYNLGIDEAIPTPVYNYEDAALSNIMPGEYKMPHGTAEPLRSGENDTAKYDTEIEKIITNLPKADDIIKASTLKIPFKGEELMFGNKRNNVEYYHNPTEVRARLNEWRLYHNVDPTKDYSNEELQQIIDDDIKNNRSRNFDLYKVIQGRGDLLKKINDSYVSTGGKENPDEMPKAQNGLPTDYELFLKYSETAPENRRPTAEWQYGNPRQYDHYGMWDALGKPKDFEQALEMNPQWQPDPYDGSYHGFSTNPNTGVWLKSHIPGESHPGDTGWMEYKDFMLSNDRNWGGKNQNLVYDPDLQRMRYVDRKEQGGDVSEVDFLTSRNNEIANTLPKDIKEVKIKSLPKAQSLGSVANMMQQVGYKPINNPPLEYQMQSVGYKNPSLTPSVPLQMQSVGYKSVPEFDAFQELEKAGFKEPASVYNEMGQFPQKLAEAFAPIDYGPFSIPEDYYTRLMQEENGINTGLKEGKYYQYPSHEKGTDTIGYGHKLTEEEEKANKYKDGLTKDEAIALMRNDVQEHLGRTIDQYTEKFGKGSFDKLHPDLKVLALDFVYNGIPITEFPNFFGAANKYSRTKNADAKQAALDEMLKQYVRHDDKGVPLGSRNEYTKGVLMNLKQTGGLAKAQKIGETGDWHFYNHPAPPRENLVGNVRKLKVQPTVAESTMPANMPKAPKEWEGKSGKQIIEEGKAQAAYEALPEALKRRDVLTADTRSDAEKIARRAWTAISNPMETIAAVNKGYDIPSGYLGMHDPYEGYNVGSPMTSTVDLAGGLAGFIGNAGYRQGEQIVDNPLGYLATNTLGLFDPKYTDQALANYMDLAAVVPIARAASPLLKNAGKSVITRTGEVKNILFEPKLTTKQASLYSREKTENLLKSLFEDTRQGWDEQYWYKQALKKQNAIKESPAYKDALDELQMADYELNQARMDNIPYMMGKPNASKKDLNPYAKRYNDAKAKISDIEGSTFDDIRHEYNQRVLNKYRFPIDSRSVDNAASGYFGKVLPVIGDDTKMLKIGNLMPWETQESFDMVNNLAKSTQDKYLGFPVKSHIFPNMDTQISKIRTPGVGIHVLNRVPGVSLMEYMKAPGGLDNLKNILSPEAIDKTMARLKFLQDNDVAVDWVNPNNFMIDPATGEVGVVDLSLLPSDVFSAPIDFTGARAISKFGVDYPALFDKAIGAYTGRYPKGASPSLKRYPRHIEQLKQNVPDYNFADEAKSSGSIWGNFDLKNPQWEVNPNNINPGNFKKGGRKKSEPGFKVFTDSKGEYVFVKT